MKEEYRVFSNNLKYFMDKFGYTQITLGDKLGVSNTTVSTWCLGDKMPRMDKIDRMCQLFNCKRSNLLEERVAESAPSRRIPVFGRVAAGIPIEAIEDIIDYEDIPSTWPGEYMALRVQGDSMTPVIRDGDTVIARRQSDAESGDIVIAQINGHDATIKKLIKHPHSITLQPFNPVYEPLVFNDNQKVAILGKVVENRQKF